jgi:hypothetical protein
MSWQCGTVSIHGGVSIHGQEPTPRRSRQQPTPLPNRRRLLVGLHHTPDRLADRRVVEVIREAAKDAIEGRRSRY